MKFKGAYIVGKEHEKRTGNKVFMFTNALEQVEEATKALEISNVREANYNEYPSEDKGKEEDHKDIDEEIVYEEMFEETKQ
jgi:hypothetical protein